MSEWIRSLSSPEGYKAAGYGPCLYHGTYNDVGVSIEQKTSYPFELAAAFHIQTEAPVEFSLFFRMPSWAIRMTVNGEVYENPDRCCSEIPIRRIWTDQEIVLTFEAEITFHRDFRNDYYVSYGPLVYCLELPAKETIKRELRVPGCCDKIYTPVKRSLEHLLIAPEDLKQFRVVGKNNCPIWNSSKILSVFLCGGRKTELEMVPMARTILRKITFSPES